MFTLTPYKPKTISFTDYCAEITNCVFDQAVAQLGDSVLFATVHGSYLYGTATSSSDVDVYLVADDVPTRQQLDECGVDVITVSTAEYFQQLQRGSVQATEAHYSPYTRFNPAHAYAQLMRHTVPNARGFINNTLGIARRDRDNVMGDLVEQKQRTPLLPATMSHDIDKVITRAARCEANAHHVLRYGFHEFSPVWIAR